MTLTEAVLLAFVFVFHGFIKITTSPKNGFSLLVVMFEAIFSAFIVCLFFKLINWLFESHVLSLLFALLAWILIETKQLWISDVMKEALDKYFLLIAFSVILIIWLIYPEVLSYFDKEELNDNAYGAFGDQFGALNTLFSGLAFAGLIYTARMQRQELEEQRLELKEQRLELKNANEERKLQTEVSQAQLNQVKIQNLESAFFRLLEYHGEIKSKITEPGNKNHDGLELFKVFWDGRNASIFQRLKSSKDQLEKSSIGERREFIKEKYTVLKDYKLYLFDRYGRTFYQLLRLIDKFPEEHKLDYAKILRSQVTKFEYPFIVYGALAHSDDKMKNYLEQFQMLKHAGMDVFASEYDPRLFREEAFGSLGYQDWMLKFK